VFTGLIRHDARVKNISNGLLQIDVDYKPKIGDSIAINGACLTVVKLFNDGFSVELSHETQKLLAMENLKGAVHIEPAMRLSDRVEGHIVQGHVDCVGVIEKIQRINGSYDFYISLPKAYQKFIIAKGSVTIDGISLTINDKTDNGFRLTIIPHTMENTLFSTYQAGRRVNIETDMFARYIYELFKKGGDKKLSWNDIDAIQAVF